MFDLGPEKLLVILIIVLVLLGPKKLPEAARSLGQAIREFRRSSSAGEPHADDPTGVDASPGNRSEPR